MPTYTQVIPAATCGRIVRTNDASPSYSRELLSDSNAPRADRSTSSGGVIARAFFEMRMGEFCANEYRAGTRLVAGSLSFPMLSGDAACRVVVHPDITLDTLDESLFPNISPASPAWSDIVWLFAGSPGRIVIPFNNYALNVLAGLATNDKRIIGLCLADEAEVPSAAIEGDPSEDYILSITTEL